MVSKTWMVLFLAVILGSTSIFALSLTGAKLSPIIYEPGKEIVNHYRISDTNKFVDVTINGELKEYFALTKVENKEFDLIIHFPDGNPPPTGSYQVSLAVTEMEEGAAASIGSLLSVTKQFTIQVYSHGKELEPSLSIPSVNEGTTLQITLEAHSRGYQDIDQVWGQITIYDPKNVSLGTVKTIEKPLPALQTQSFKNNYETTGLRAGEYWANAVVYYDGNSKNTGTTFRIGNMDLVLKNYTSQVEQGFSEFRVIVLNNWGNKLKNVYAKIYFQDREVLQTPTISMNPWQEDTLKGILNINQTPGNYTGKIQLYFEGETKDAPIQVEILPKKIINETKPQLEPDKGSVVAILFGIIISLIIIIAIIIYLMITRKNEN